MYRSVCPSLESFTIYGSITKGNPKWLAKIRAKSFQWVPENNKTIDEGTISTLSNTITSATVGQNWSWAKVVSYRIIKWIAVLIQLRV